MLPHPDVSFLFVTDTLSLQIPHSNKSNSIRELLLLVPEPFLWPIYME